MSGKLPRIRLTTDATTMRDLKRAYVSTIQRLQRKEISEKDAKTLGSLLNGLRDTVLRAEKRLPISKNLKKKTAKKLQEWNKEDGSQ